MLIRIKDRVYRYIDPQEQNLRRIEKKQSRGEMRRKKRETEKRRKEKKKMALTSQV